MFTFLGAVTRRWDSGHDFTIDHESLKSSGKMHNHEQEQKNVYWVYFL